MESLCIPEVTDSGISGLGTTLLMCQGKRSAALSVAGLKEFCCVYN
jgi:hypothetical protein